MLATASTNPLRRRTGAVAAKPSVSARTAAASISSTWEISRLKISRASDDIATQRHLQGAGFGPPSSRRYGEGYQFGLLTLRGLCRPVPAGRWSARTQERGILAISEAGC